MTAVVAGLWDGFLWFIVNERGGMPTVDEFCPLVVIEAFVAMVTR